MQALRALDKGREGENAFDTHASGFFNVISRGTGRVSTEFGCVLPRLGASGAQDAAKGWLSLELRSDSMLRRLGREHHSAFNKSV